SIRRTARKLNLPSDASYRFERGVDPGMILRASQRAAELMRELAGGEPASKIWVAGELPPDPPNVNFRYRQCDQLLGVNVAPSQADAVLAGFGLTKGEVIDDGATWRISSHRLDLRRYVD